MSVVARRFVEPDHERRVSQFELLPVEPGDVVFLGDSITAGGAWHELFPGVPVRNRGIGGDVTAGVLARLDAITAGQPGKIFLKIGTNDLRLGRDPAEIAADVAEIARRVQRSSPDTLLFVQSVLPRAAGWAGAVEELNVALEQAVKEAGAIWIDLVPHFLDPAKRSIRNDLSNDELHLLGEGYLLWRSRIEGYVHSTPSEWKVELEDVDLAGIASVAQNDGDSWRLVGVWATWCTPCLVELPLLGDLATRYRSRALEVVTLSIDDFALRDDALALLSEMGVATRNLIVGAVESNELIETLDPQWQGLLPYTLLIAPGGEVAYRKQGAFDPVELEREIERQLVGSAS
jgi:lysophospholipase L1-like esterase